MKAWRKYTLPELRAEFQKIGLPYAQSEQKAFLIARLKEYYGSFTLFPKLPRELQNMVWDAALPKWRLVPSRLGAQGKIRVDDHAFLRNILQTSHDARTYLLEKLQKSSFTAGIPVYSLIRQHTIFNADRDILHFTTKLYDWYMALSTFFLDQVSSTSPA